MASPSCDDALSSIGLRCASAIANDDADGCYSRVDFSEREASRFGIPDAYGAGVSATPMLRESKKARATLRQQLADRGREIERLRAVNAKLQAQVTMLLARVAELEEKLRADSSNSSKPPSSDPPGAPRPPKKEPSGRRPGGQPGHKGTTRPLVPPEQVDHFNDYLPSHCGSCGMELTGCDPDPVRQQYVDIPLVKPTVTESRLHALGCPCGVTTRAQLPSNVPQGAFGLRVQALAGVLSGCYRLSRRNVEQIMSDVFFVDISLGSIKAREDATSDALLPQFEEAKAYVHAQPCLHADETGWRQKPDEPAKAGLKTAEADPKKPDESAIDQAKQRAEDQKRARAWLWTAVTPLMALFLIRRSRGSQSAKELIGAGYKGIVNSDRWCGYNWILLYLRQICWAHLKRDFKNIAERGGDAKVIGDGLLACAKELFRLWHRVRDGTLKRSSFQTYVSPIRSRVHDLLSQGATSADSKVAGMCKKILEVEPALWTFVRVPGVEPTNNAAERAIRPAVIWRRTSFGTQSENGSTFVERMLTVVTSLRLQKRNVLEFVTAACAAALEDRPPPSLLPEKPAASDPR